MQTLQLVTDQSITFQDLFQRIREKWSNVYWVSNGRIGLKDGDTSLFIDRNDDALDEYDPDVLEKLMKLIPTPHFYAIQYSLAHTNLGELVRRLILTIADDARIVIDNDRGLMMAGPAFVRRLKDDPSWDWFNAGESAQGRIA